MKISFFHFIFSVIIAVLVTAGFGVWYSMVSNESTAVAALENQISAKKETTNRITTARASFAEIADEKAVVQNYFVPESEIVSFINNLEMGEKESSAIVKVRSVSTKTIPRSVFILTLLIKGTFDGVMRAAGAIENFPYALKITSFSIGQGGKDSWNADLSLEVGSTSSTIAVNTP